MDCRPAWEMRCRLTLRLLDEIPPEASGKHRYVVSHVPLAESLKQAAA